ncbi:peptidase M48 [Aliidiomarina minuta]|uniref:Putative beta-barrel assembly-enhancing protease n=1 Tax=Aliidiomarina minuta TaxID=880057 RepID=A0A432W781_9GAMM|nr:M48 family metalloprotease [Aliidiomarina minuta]RUO25892.1 peptidase M48 [Aliidiomarina minuta]
MGFKLASKFIVFATTYLLLILVTIDPVKANQRSELPTIGTAGAGTMSIDRERLLGDFYIRQIRAQAPLAEDPVLREYLSDLGNRLVLHADNVRFPFHFFWVRDSSINAFAFLGGHVGIHTGLIENAEDESELASVVAHEIAHVTQRHIARNMERMNEAAPVSFAQIIGGIVLAMANPQLGMAVMTGSIAGIQQRQINYTRQFEIEADRFGMATLARAGFDPHGAPRFFGRLASRYRYSTQVPQYLVTHPLPESRIADTRERAQQLGQPNLEPSLQFELAKARVKVRYTNTSARNALSQARTNEERASHSNTKAAARYAQALALYELERLAEADKILMALHEEDRLNLFYIDTITDTWIKQGRYEEIVEFLTQAYIRRPNNQVLTLNLAFAANEAQQYDLSVKILNEFIMRNRDDRVAYQLLQEAHQGAGDAVSMHEAQAEIFALTGNFELAIEELNNAHSKVAEDRTLSRQRIRGRIEQMRKLERDRERVMRM